MIRFPQLYRRLNRKMSSVQKRLFARQLRKDTGNGTIRNTDEPSVAIQKAKLHLSKPRTAKRKPSSIQRTARSSSIQRSSRYRQRRHSRVNTTRQLVNLIAMALVVAGCSWLMPKSGSPSSSSKDKGFLEWNGLKFRIHDVGNDGNCQYRAISMCVHGTEYRHRNIRKTVIDEIRKHPEFYEDFIAGEGNYFDIDDFINNNAKDRTWGCNITLQAYANSQNCEVHVCSAVQDQILEPNEDRIKKNAIQTHPSSAIHLLHKPEYHYLALIETT